MREMLEDIVAKAAGAWRFRWHAMVVAWIFCLIGWFSITLVPDRYGATARVYIDTHSMLNPLMSGLTVDSQLEQQLNAVSRTLVTRPNLERLVKTANLDAGLRNAGEREALLDRLATRIEFKGAGADNLFSLAYSDRRPEQAKKVVETLLSIFLDSSMGGLSGAYGGVETCGDDPEEALAGKGK